MRKYRTESERERYCREFLSSALPQTKFCVENNLSPSVFHRWMKAYRQKNSLEPESKLVEIKLRESLPIQNFTNIQMFLPNGIRIDLPSGFDPKSLKIILGAISG